VNRGLVCIEIRDGKVWRIFRSRKSASIAGLTCQTSVMAKVDAERTIKKQLWDLAKGKCTWCSKDVPLTGGGLYNNSHIHEQDPRGKGGEVSMENSIILCYDCHMNVAHGNRKLQFGIRQDVVE
jgi:5-methylcytosine-specific restriction endonuclease McrA